MEWLNGLLGLKRKPVQQQVGQPIQQPVAPTTLPRIPMPSTERARFKVPEDAGLVQANQRMMPLSDVGRGQTFVDPNSMTVGGTPRPRRRSSLEGLLNF